MHDSLRITITYVFYVIFAVFIFWKALSFGLSEFFTTLPDNPKNNNYENALRWNSDNPIALFKNTEESAPSTFDDVHEQILQAISKAPTHGYMLLPLAQYWLEHGQVFKSDQLAKLAKDLTPSNSNVDIQLAAYWLTRKDLPKAIEFWSEVLEKTRVYDSQLFDVFLQFVDSQKGLESLVTIATDNPSWWPRFFKYAEAKISALEKLGKVFSISRIAKREITVAERERYLNRLMREKKWGDAYFAWLNSLDNEERQNLGQIYNGGFENKIANSGFSWQLTSTESAAVDQVHTYGAKGEKALKIVFRNKELQFKHLYQNLHLSAGKYRLRGRVRKDSIRTSKGIQWVIHCAEGKRQLLTESERFIGVDEWKSFYMDFSIPRKNCGIQRLRLQVLGKRKADFRTNGVLWFDDLRIRRLQ